MAPQRSLIINAPWYVPQAHQTLLALFTKPNYHGLFSKIIFMGSSAPLAALKPSALLSSYLSATAPDSTCASAAAISGTGAAASAGAYAHEGQVLFEVLDELGMRYRQWAQQEGISLLVCGMAAKRFYQDSKLSTFDGLALTGYMEVLSVINGPIEEVVIW
ncbi:hypothetical protein MXE38_07065 [Anaerobiospirillum sp. NML120448]|uniref:hypothetical protein n=1 Tax=Anaerobiospirillum sp. NML120448 TaxID=2932816 RepID=UPI001FF3B9E0|nr:hypothetical protein [Anaerobiospirillum sp. NML120448]MCK0514607.1 hypothetical protein [Anaerobiospirillum sp. NML120448]